MKKITVILIIALVISSMLVGGCVRGLNIDFGSPFNGIEKTGKESTSLKAEGTEKLEVVNQTGNISVSKSNGGDIGVRLEKKVRGQVEEEINKVLDEMKISVKYSGGACIIKVVASDGTTDFWKWQRQNYPMLNINADLYVDLPENFANYTVNLVTGNIDMNDLSGKFQIDSTTGNITLSNLSMTGNNKVDLTTGNITISSDIAGADSLYVRNTTGNLDLSFPGDSSAKLKVSLTTGNIGGSLLGQTSTALGGSTIEKTLGDGKTDVNVDNVTGNISVNKK